MIAKKPGQFQEAISTCDHIIKVKDFGADPTGQEDSTIAIWQALQHAKKLSGRVLVDFEKGTYQLQKGTAQQREYHTSNTNSIEYPIKYIPLLIEDQEDLLINGNGSIFMIHGDCMALGIVRSKNIHLYNFSWDFTDPTTIEMTVSQTGVSAEGEYADFYIPKCFTYEISDNEKDIIWYSDKNPETDDYYWVDKNHKDAWTLVGFHPEQSITRRYDVEYGPFNENRTRIVQLDDRTVRVYYKNQRPSIQKEGFVFEFCSTPRRETAGAFIWESENIVNEEVNVHYMHAFGWLTQMSHNVSYFNCVFKTREESERYTSSYADLIHISGASGLIHIEGCTFNHAHDDPINVHGTFTRVERKIDDHTLELKYIQSQQGGFPQYYVGNEVVFYQRNTLRPGSDDGKRYIVKNAVNPGENEKDLRTMIVSFEQKLPDDLTHTLDDSPLFVAENVTFTPKVHIKNNLFDTISTRGILCTTQKQVIIEDNTFRHMTMDSIYLSNDSQYWYESGPLRNVTIRRNKFYVTKVGGANWRNAAIRIDPITLNSQLPPFSDPIHCNIQIIDNEFYMEHESVLSAKSVGGITFKNNIIQSYQPEIDDSLPLTKLGDDRPMSFDTKLFEFTSCSQVEIEDNNFASDLNLDLTYREMPFTEIKGGDVQKLKQA